MWREINNINVAYIFVIDWSFSCAAGMIRCLVMASYVQLLMCPVMMCLVLLTTAPIRSTFPFILWVERSRPFTINEYTQIPVFFVSMLNVLFLLLHRTAPSSMRLNNFFLVLLK